VEHDAEVTRLDEGSNLLFSMNAPFAAAAVFAGYFYTPVRRGSAE
jgi:hypothetical protein